MWDPFNRKKVKRLEATIDNMLLENASLMQQLVAKFPKQPVEHGVLTIGKKDLGLRKLPKPSRKGRKENQGIIYGLGPNMTVAKARALKIKK